MNNKRGSLVWLGLLPLLAGCISDAASWQIDGQDHAITLIRNQQWFFSSRVDLSVVLARLPECQRRHTLLPTTSSQATVDVYQTGANEFILKQGARYYLAETRTCSGFQKLDGEPGSGVGARTGSFREQGGKLRFVVDGKSG